MAFLSDSQKQISDVQKFKFDQSVFQYQTDQWSITRNAAWNGLTGTLGRAIFGAGRTITDEENFLSAEDSQKRFGSKVPVTKYEAWLLDNQIQANTDEKHINPNDQSFLSNLGYGAMGGVMDVAGVALAAGVGMGLTAAAPASLTAAGGAGIATIAGVAIASEGIGALIETTLTQFTRTPFENLLYDNEIEGDYDVSFGQELTENLLGALIMRGGVAVARKGFGKYIPSKDIQSKLDAQAAKELIESNKTNPVSEVVPEIKAPPIVATVENLTKEHFLKSDALDVPYQKIQFKKGDKMFGSFLGDKFGLKNQNQMITGFRGMLTLTDNPNVARRATTSLGETGSVGEFSLKELKVLNMDEAVDLKELSTYLKTFSKEVNGLSKNKYNGFIEHLETMDGEMISYKDLSFEVRGFDNVVEGNNNIFRKFMESKGFNAFKESYNDGEYLHISKDAVKGLKSTPFPGSGKINPSLQKGIVGSLSKLNDSITEKDILDIPENILEFNKVDNLAAELVEDSKASLESGMEDLKLEGNNGLQIKSEKLKESLLEDLKVISDKANQVPEVSAMAKAYLNCKL